MSDMKADQTWGMLADLEEEEGRTKLLQRYTDLASLPEGERASQMLTMTTAEYDPPDDKLPTFTLSRLSVWLGMVAGVRKIQQMLTVLPRSRYQGHTLCAGCPRSKPWPTNFLGGSNYS